ncbi:MAG: hypothetical protein M9936_16210 [Caldilinea sp.]|mgnify:CR=1 FL=1|nr:hypothetical protein [Caldilinea sp.]MCO5211237.1 hypothetical protein [Caldilinea sp.]
MNTTIDHPHRRFYFWLFDWSTTSISAGYNRPGYILCEIDNFRLIIFSGPEPTETPIDNIESAKIVSWAGVPATIVSINVLLRLKRQIDTPGRKVYRPNELVVAPMDVYTFKQSREESKTLIKVINALQSGEPASVEPNPYLRCRQPRLRVPREAPNGPWDPTVPPYIYSEPPYAPRRSRAILAAMLFSLFVIVPVVTLVLGLIANALLGQR